MSRSRLYGPLVEASDEKSSFGSGAEHERMARLRRNVQTIRKAWLTNESYREIITTVQRYCQPADLATGVQEPLTRLLGGFRDYADIAAERPVAHEPERYDAIELYCSEDGYEYLFKIMSRALRMEGASDDLLLTATVLVELVTIDLYNLRLSQIGDPKFANYQGIVYRGLQVSQQQLDEYKMIMARPDLSQRGFAVPLALLSASSDEVIMENFSKQGESVNKVAMHWTIHVHGIDADLLDTYRQRYPNSVVTSICAMPIGRVSSLNEKEILLRGAFFQLIDINKSSVNGRDVWKLVLVTMNTNRDHTTEQASDENEKKLQRETFARIITASKYEVCAKVAEEHSVADAKGYKALQKAKLDAIRTIDAMQVIENSSLADERSGDVTVWLGGSTMKSYPQHYAKLRMSFRDAIIQEDWSAVESIIEQEYEWRRTEWFNVFLLHDDSGASIIDGHKGLNTTKGETGDDADHNFTLLHQLILRRPKSVRRTKNYLAWERLLETACSNHVWKSVKSLDKSPRTASDIAIEQNLGDVAERLRSKNIQEMRDDVLKILEEKLHTLIRSVAGESVEQYAFRLPQLSVLLEMRDPRIWIPIPGSYGGLLISLDAEALQVKVYELQHGQVQHRVTDVRIDATQA